MSLRTWEVNFSYLEHGEKKNTLVKLRLCPACSNKLNFHKTKREIKRLKKNKRRSRSTIETTESSGSNKNEIPSNPAPSTSKESETLGQVENHNLEKSCWTGGAVEVELERNREDEFDEYLEDLLL